MPTRDTALHLFAVLVIAVAGIATAQYFGSVTGVYVAAVTGVMSAFITFYGRNNTG